MSYGDSLASDLEQLSEALGESGVDLAEQLTAFVDSVQDAVDSYLGLSMTIPAGGQSFDFAVMSSDAPIGSTLTVSLSALSDAAGGTLVLYAATPGAFVDLAADLQYALHPAPGALVLDDGLAGPGPSSGLDGYSLVNQAVGVLLARGHTVEDAHAHLRELADRSGSTLLAAARGVLDSVRPG